MNKLVEKQIERAIDRIIEHDYIDGEGYEWRPRYRRKGTPKNKGFKKEPYKVYR